MSGLSTHEMMTEKKKKLTTNRVPSACKEWYMALAPPVLATERDTCPLARSLCSVCQIKLREVGVAGGGCGSSFREEYSIGIGGGRMEPLRCIGGAVLSSWRHGHGLG